MKDGFVKAAAASPVIALGDCDANAGTVVRAIREADDKGVKVLVFPELTLTGVTCFDLTGHRVLLEGARRALLRVAEETAETDVLSFVGLPVILDGQVVSAAAAVCGGEVLGLVPKFGGTLSCAAWRLDRDHLVYVGADTLFTHAALPELKVGVELGEELDLPLSRAAAHAAAGATVIAQMASFAETVSSTDDAMLRIVADSRRLKCGLVLAAPGRGESTTDRVYSGLCLVAENGEILAQSEGADSCAVSEIDVQLLENLRLAAGTFGGSEEYSEVEFGADELSETALTRTFRRYPHLPATAEELPAYCRRQLDIQVNGLVRRMEYAHLDHCVVGISGGVDSTLCVMVCAMAVRKMGLPSKNVIACTMPCFGTSSRTKNNAVVVAERWGCDVRVIDISESVYQHFDDIGHAHDDYSVAFENAQARERTQVLMDIANKVNGLDVGTEDLSEFIDGWCTYNGDHTANYDVNLGLTKTQVRANVSYIAATTEDKELKAALYDVLDCPVTPELLPIHDDMIEQKSEEAVGSYSLQDFFTYCILSCGFTPSKTYRLAMLAYAGEYTREEMKRWLTSWCKRLFSQQFKRSCLMDGPAVMDFTVSPRTGFLMPSDAQAALFLKDLETI